MESRYAAAAFSDGINPGPDRWSPVLARSGGTGSDAAGAARQPAMSARPGGRAQPPDSDPDDAKIAPRPAADPFPRPARGPGGRPAANHHGGSGTSAPANHHGDASPRRPARASAGVPAPGRAAAGASPPRGRSRPGPRSSPPPSGCGGNDTGADGGGPGSRP